MSQFYLNKPNILKAGEKVVMTQEDIDEFNKCADDPLYFIENYCYIIHPDKGLIKFSLYPYQKRLVKLMHGEPEEADLLKAPFSRATDDDGEFIKDENGEEIWDYRPKNVIVKTSRQVGKCVVGGSTVEIRNKKTGIVEKIAIQELYNRSKPTNAENDHHS